MKTCGVLVSEEKIIRKLVVIIWKKSLPQTNICKRKRPFRPCYYHPTLNIGFYEKLFFYLPFFTHYFSLLPCFFFEEHLWKVFLTSYLRWFGLKSCISNEIFYFFAPKLNSIECDSHVCVPLHITYKAGHKLVTY